MNSLRFHIKPALVFVAMLAVARMGQAQAEAPASPEPGDSPVVEKVEVTAAALPLDKIAVPAEPKIQAEAVPGSASATAHVPKSIDQRVDNVSTDEVIRVAPKPRKNVSRLDNKPNRPKATLIAVIHGPMSPWGYANRYMSGEVTRPAAKDLQGSTARPGVPDRQGRRLGHQRFLPRWRPRVAGRRAPWTPTPVR